MIAFKTLHHFLITVPTGEKENAVRFYEEVIGLASVPGNHPNNACWFKIGDIELHIREEDETTHLSNRHAAFTVKNLEEAKLHLQKAGLELSYAAKIENRDRFFFRDPWGNRFELIELNSYAGADAHQ